MSLTGECLGMPLASMVGYDRKLADAGVRRKGGRGRAVAQVIPRDAANLLTAILGGGQVKDAVTTVGRYGATRPHVATSSRSGWKALKIPRLSLLGQTHSFVDAIEALLAAIGDGSVARAMELAPGREQHGMPVIEIAALAPGTLGDIRVAAIQGRTAHIRYAPSSRGPKTDAAQSWQSRVGVRPGSDLEQMRRISERTVWRIGQLFSDTEATA